MPMARGKQVIRGVEYVFEYDSAWKKEKGYSTHKRVYIGKNVDGVFVPNRIYKAQLELQVAKSQRQTGPVAVVASNRYFFGATYLFDEIGGKLGITQDLRQCFPQDWRQILSIAYYLILEDRNPLSRFPKWAATHAHPFGEDIPSQRSSELFAGIGENQKQEFFKRQAARRLEKEYLAYDTTSVSSYSKSLKQVKYGKNKEREPLAQINLALLFGEASRLPVYYRKLAGNIPDVKTIRNLLADIDFLELQKVNLVMDRGFYSEENINALYQKHYKFLIAVQTSLRFVKSRLEEVRSSMTTRPFYSSKYRIYAVSSMEDWAYTEVKKDVTVTGTRRVYLHLYYNDDKAKEDRNDFNDHLDMLENELLTDSRKSEHEKLYGKYFDIQQTPVRGMSLEPKQEAIDAAEKDYGYFALLSNGVKDPWDALEIYRSKDLIEKAFGNLKERLNMRRTSVSSSQNLDGKLFVQFVALIYLSYVKKAMIDHNLFGTYTLQEFLDELDVIERFEHPGRKPFLGEITKKQKELYNYLEIPQPV